MSKMVRLNSAYNPTLNTVLVSGANGFVGRPLCERLFQQGQSLIRVDFISRNKMGKKAISIQKKSFKNKCLPLI